MIFNQSNHSKVNSYKIITKVRVKNTDEEGDEVINGSAGMSIFCWDQDGAAELAAPSRLKTQSRSSML